MIENGKEEGEKPDESISEGSYGLGIAIAGGRVFESACPSASAADGPNAVARSVQRRRVGGILRFNNTDGVRAFAIDAAMRIPLKHQRGAARLLHRHRTASDRHHEVHRVAVRFQMTPQPPTTYEV